MNEDELTPQQRMDLLLYGEAFSDEQGNRIDPRTVAICSCKQAPWIPPCRHKGGTR